MPNMRPLATDSDVLVRVAFAHCIAPLAECGARFIGMLSPSRRQAPTTAIGRAENADQLASYDTKLAEFQLVIQEQITQLLLADTSAAVRRALVQYVAPLCIFFGRHQASDVLLSHMITFLNDRDWQLRAAFFDSSVALASCVGGRSVDDYILPLMLQALAGTFALTQKLVSRLSDMTYA